MKFFSEEDTLTSPPSSLRPASSPSVTLQSKEIPEVDLSSWSSPTVKSWNRGTFQSEEISSSLVDFSATSVSEEHAQTPLSSSKPPLAPKPSLEPREIPNEDLDPTSSLTVEPQSRRTFQSDETSSFPLELPFKSTSGEPQDTSPPSSPKPPSFSKSMLLSKPPLAPKPKFISSEVTPSHHPKNTSPPSLAAPVTRRFPAPSEPPPPPPEKRSPPESSPLAISEDLLDLDGCGSSLFDDAQPHSPLSAPSVTEDDSASVHQAQSAPKLGSSDVLQRDEGSGLSSSEPEVETSLRESNIFYGKKPSTSVSFLVGGGPRAGQAGGDLGDQAEAGGKQPLVLHIYIYLFYETVHDTQPTISGLTEVVLFLANWI